MAHPLKIRITELREGENHLTLRNATDASMKEVLEHVEAVGIRAESDCSAELNLTKCEPDYYLRGTLCFSLQQTCARCGEHFLQPIRHDFDIALAYVSPGAPGHRELARDLAETGANVFEDNVIDLGPVLEEQFVLSIPYVVLCKDDCGGICQRCGKNLNLGPCQCEPPDNQRGHQKGHLETPFSVLKGLKH